MNDWSLWCQVLILWCMNLISEWQGVDDRPSEEPLTLALFQGLVWGAWERHRIRGQHDTIHTFQQVSANLWKPCTGACGCLLWQLESNKGNPHIPLIPSPYKCALILLPASSPVSPFSHLLLKKLSVWGRREGTTGERVGERGRDKGIAKRNYRRRMWVSVHKLNNNLLLPHNYQITQQITWSKWYIQQMDAYQPIPQYCVPEHI